ncbi:MAG: hypothetical protein FJ122_12000 [Deltaproteobacteria bacterium]|nr:hypothetical protein [Deltaproteobacteria bacterium]
MRPSTPPTGRGLRQALPVTCRAGRNRNERERGAQVIALSALLTTTMIQMQEAVRMIRTEGLNVKVVVGGAPVTAAFAGEIGADGYAEDAASAVGMVKEALKANQ